MARSNIYKSNTVCLALFTGTMGLLCIWHYSKYFILLILTILWTKWFLLYQCSKKGTERLRTLTKVTQVESDETRWVGSRDPLLLFWEWVVGEFLSCETQPGVRVIWGGSEIWAFTLCPKSSSIQGVLNPHYSWTPWESEKLPAHSLAATFFMYNFRSFIDSLRSYSYSQGMPHAEGKKKSNRKGLRPDLVRANAWLSCLCPQ